MKISLLIPVKDQTDKLLANLKEKIIPYFDSTGITYDILICSDHSSKEEQAKLEQASKDFPAQVKLLPYEDKKGKGFAIKKAILASNCDYDFFMDADLATDLHIFDLIKKDLGQYDAFIASRDLPDSVYVRKQPFIRRLTHWGAKRVVRNKFHMKNIHDTQCGFKGFRDNIAKIMVSKQICEQFAFDVEYCYFLCLNGFSIKEVPARWEDDPDSSVGSPLKATIAFYKDLKRIKKNKANYILTSEDKEELYAH